MSDISNATGPAGDAPETRSKHRGRRRARRIALISVTAVLAVICGGLVSAYVTANHLASGVHRIPGVFTGIDEAQLAAAKAAKGSLTMLVTGNDVVTSRSGPHSRELPSGLIAIVHLNAGRNTGAVVSIPPETLVKVPGHGRMQIERTLTAGGPALLVRTVQSVTHDRIDHYGVVDFARVANVVNALGGVNGNIPRATTSFGFRFHAGINHLSGAAAIAYVRQPSLTEDQRVARQQNLLRAILQKIAGQNLLGNPLRAYRIIHAFTQALSVDSNFSNRDLMSLVTSARSFRPGHGTFVTAPVRHAGSAVTFVEPEASQLWRAIRTDSVAAFARQYPATVTPVAPE
jgi:LCP family protein required for cell wall assembly